MRWPRLVTISLFSMLILFLCFSDNLPATDYQIGVYYFPGWNSRSEYWNDLMGLSGSRSPGKAWLDREPLRGFGYPEESEKIAEQNIEWASNSSISFFAYDWYWDGRKTYLNHAINNHLKSKNKHKMKFCVLWANHSNIPESLEDFTGMVQYWIDNYLKDSQYLTVSGKPVVIVFSPQQLRDNAKRIKMTTKELFTIARDMAVRSGLNGIYFVGATQANSYWVNNYLPTNSYDAITAYNYHSADFDGQYTGNERPSESFDELLSGYKKQWSWIQKNSKLPYIVPMSAGWDRRPWGGSRVLSHDRSGSDPTTFKEMLVAGRDTICKDPNHSLKMGIIYAWNEFGEGAYIEPTKKWGFLYLQVIKEVFRRPCK